MLKTRIIPILTFNGFGLVKTKNFKNPRMVGNPVQAARVFNKRGVDELIFLDIFATKQKRKINLKIVKEVIKECFMPVGIGGGISSIEDINDLLKIGADKVVLKDVVLNNPTFVTKASNYFGSQCLTIAADVYLNIEKGNFYIYNDLGIEITMEEFLQQVQSLGAGEIILSSVDHDGLMRGFDIKMINEAQNHTTLPIVCVGGGGHTSHYKELFQKTSCEAVGSASIFYFTQFTPLDLKNAIKEVGKAVRI